MLCLLPTAWLPNQPGFRFLGSLHSGETVDCTVTVGPDGLCRVLEVPVSQLRGWHPLLLPPTTSARTPRRSAGT